MQVRVFLFSLMSTSDLMRNSKDWEVLVEHDEALASL